MKENDLEFSAELKKHENLNSAYIEIPFDVVEVFGAKRVKVKATFDGVPYRGSIVRMGGIYMIGVNQEIRAQMDKEPGAVIAVCVEKDTEERTVELPEEVAKRIASSRMAQEFWDSLSYSKRREFVQWIEGAKQEKTRERRIEKTFELLEAGEPLK